MQKVMLIDAVHPEEMRMVITDSKSTIHEYDFTTAAKQQIKGNIYLAKVTRVEPSLQAAFVEYGGGKQGFLPFAEIHTDYYQIPVADRKRLMEEEAAEEEAEEQEAAGGSAGGYRRGRRRRGRDYKRNRQENAPQADSDSATPESEGDGTVAENTGLETAEYIASEEVVAEDLQNEQAIAAEQAETEQAELPLTAESPETEKQESADSSDATETTEVETLSSEEEIERPRRRSNLFRRYKIQEVIKRNQILLVQVIKEERGNKGVSLTTFLSLAGRYCVLMPNSPRGGGVSRKINTGDDRKRLKTIISDLELPHGMSVIIRTAGSNRTRAEIKRDFDYLVKLWNQIREDTLSSSAPALIYEESNLIKRSIRDSYSTEIEEILVNGEAAYKEAKAFMRMLVPSHAARVKQHKGNLPLFYEYRIEEQLLSMNDPVVKLRSGGYIVLNPTEALISIDVNSGRSTSERNIEETAFKTNSEAALEIARQLRLRDLAGLIVIDFIDMLDGKNRRQIERNLKDALRSDRAKIQIGRISPFGLLELSRQRLRPSISEAMLRPCEHCHGTGSVRSDASVAIQIIRNLEKEAGLSVVEKFRVYLTPSVAVYLINTMREKLSKLEQDFGLTIDIQIDTAMHEGNFRIEKFRSKEKREKDSFKGRPQQTAEPEEEELEESAVDSESGDTPQAENDRNESEKSSRKRRDRRRRRGGKNHDGFISSKTEEQDAPAEKQQDETQEDSGFQDRGRGRNRNRSRNRYRSSEGESPRWDNENKKEASAEPDFGAPPLESSVNLIISQLPPAQISVPAPHVQATPKSNKPARKGWWQKIIE